LSLACFAANSALAVRLIEAGAELDARDQNSNTPLLLACEKKLGDTAALLIERGSDVEASNALGMTPLHQAAASGLAEIVPVLIAKGADVPFSTIALINARTEVLKLAQRGSLGRSSLPVDPDPDGCTSVVLLPEATANGRLIHAQNWDWKVECAETSVVLSIQSEGKPDILTFTEAGGLARSGLNSAGLAITANYLESDRDYTQIGVPLALIRRKALECSHLAQAIHAVYVTPKSASNNVVLSHADGMAFNFECAPDESFLVHPVNGLLVHANHWISPIALGKLKDTGIATVPDSVYRDLRVRSLLAPKLGQATMRDMQEALFDDFQTPWSVCRPPRLTLNDNLSATVAMIVMDPGEGIMQVAPLPALNRNFTTYRLNKPYSKITSLSTTRKTA
jgi:isopenicillin-N N-acyltransferase-like protein